MMMRFISTSLIPSLGGSSARIDFDYLNPDYPGRSPALLLAALAEELSLYDKSGAATRLFARFGAKRATLDERLRDMPLAARANGGTVDWGGFAEVLDSFADAVKLLPKPVVLLLDTCEELSKLRHDGSIPANVKWTFDILIELQKNVQDIRVVFGGRRPLASKGAGWSTPMSRLIERPYLRLHEVRGFTEGEARRFLDEKTETRAELVSAILERSRDEKVPERFKWDSPDDQPARVTRYSPFELRLYADWGRDDEELTVASIRADDPHRYVQMRIVGRIGHAGLRALLPAVAVLGRFDYATLRATTTLDDEAFNTLVEELADQEWVDRQANQFLDVDHGLRPKLLAYYRGRDPVALELARRAAAEHLRAATLEQPLRLLDVSHFEACMRLLRDDLETATAWWREVEARFAREQEYEWARGLLYRIIDQRASAEARREQDRVDRALMASVTATYAAALVHTAPQADLDVLWTEVEEAAQEHPIEAERTRLLTRARAGRVAGACQAGRAPTADDVSALRLVAAAITGDGQETASLIAALEAMVEHDETQPEPHMEILDVVRSMTSSRLEFDMPHELRAYCVILLIRCEARLGVLDEETLKRAVSVATGGASHQHQPWLDWLAPDHLEARIRLEAVRAAASHLPPHEIVEMMQQWPPLPRPVSIDYDRLASAQLLVHRAVSPVIDLTVSDVHPLFAELTGATSMEPRCNAHRAYPPVVTVLAEELASQGRADEALDRLQSAAVRTEQATTSGAAVRSADLASARIIVRMRLQDAGRTVSLPMGDLESAELLWMLEGLDGQRAAQAIGLPSIAEEADAPEAWLHARWRTLYGLTPGHAGTAIAWASVVRGQFAGPATRSESASCELDWVEADELAARIGQPTAAQGDRASVMADWRTIDVADREKLWRLRLRTYALDPDPSRPMPREAIAERLGQRRAAEIELDEGDALALRLPRLAQPLLSDARRRFQTCGDDVGALRAGISEALVLVRSGNVKRLQKLCAAELSRILDRIAVLPDWERIRSIAARGAPDELDSIAPPEWVPWLTRLVACAAWLFREQKVSEAAPAVQTWLESRYGRQMSQGALLPAELDGLLAEPSRAGTRRRAKRSRLRYFLPWMMVGISLLAIVVISGIFLRTVSQGRSVSSSPPAVPVILVALSFLFSLLALLLYWRELRSALSSRRTTVVTVRAGPGDTVRTVEPVVSTTIALERGRRRLEPMPATIAIGAGYDAAAEELPGAAVLELRRIARRSGLFTTRVELRVDRQTSAVCWEGLLAHAAAAITGPRSIPFMCTRTTEVVPIASATDWRHIRQIASFTSSPHEDAMARKAWSTLPSRRFTVVPARLAALRGTSYPDAHVVHMVAHAVETASAVRLELQSPDAAAKAVRETARGDLLRADELPRMFPRAGLYVLQSPPLHTPARTHAEREQAALLRAFAAELAELGVPAVVTVPACTEATASAILIKVADSLRGRVRYPWKVQRHGARGLLRSVRSAATMLPLAVRRIERSEFADGRGLDLEAAFDICVYANSWDPDKASARTS